MIVFTPFYFLAPRKNAWFVPKFWAKTHLWLMKVIVGTDHVVIGKENLPAGSYILAPKHQSVWDTFAFLPWWPDPVYILKRELTWVPIFGWYLAKMDMIAIDRGNRATAIASVNRGARRAVEQGRQIVIYPEGTRRSPGAEASYKMGIVNLYEALDVPVVPIAHNAGLYWRRRTFMRYPGTIKVEILKPIQPGLGRDEFRGELIRRIEEACDRQLLELADDPTAPPFPETARKRVAELRAEAASPTSA
ncbi:lysophospholipid acyltransferase family protein [Oricola cellulosilytica]|uniref:1-acyl-sn-glycerol-3-phosphate acyltransferase n=1 Tax=Oricola cellulosilytica TaxID=1429082 RepID=A0A4R0PEU8_9HYPH|nr:1-acyl-sn-glycerol-3-phosphate acyltransferase [Oricola cellulosilytica]TCD13903.1 1-acyl-sn-glycerol-3-phosphate acyltransferase [Oricola cellulosilytica]